MLLYELAMLSLSPVSSLIFKAAKLILQCFGIIPQHIVNSPILLNELAHFFITDFLIDFKAAK